MVQGLEQTISAQNYAEKLVNDWKGTLQHSANNDRPGQGENLAYNWEATPAAACKKATNQWYDEIKDYNYAKPGFAMNTGHFTQVLYGNVIEFKKKYSLVRISLYLEALRNPLIRTIFHNIDIFLFLEV